jgi:hypothetical protein
VFVCDGTLSVTARPGSSTKVHLRDDLVLDGTVLAPAGTPARLVVGGSTTAGGQRAALVAIDQFRTKFGLLPVRPKTASLPAVAPGVTIDATTLARVEHLGDRYAIDVPFPFALSTEVPVSAYTATPARTPAALIRPIIRGRRTPAPSPTATSQATMSPTR